jgi:hypothetical protein
MIARGLRQTSKQCSNHKKQCSWFAVMHNFSNGHCTLWLQHPDGPGLQDACTIVTDGMVTIRVENSAGCHLAAGCCETHTGKARAVLDPGFNARPLEAASQNFPRAQRNSALLDSRMCVLRPVQIAKYSGEHATGPAHKHSAHPETGMQCIWYWLPWGCAYSWLHKLDVALHTDTSLQSPMCTHVAAVKHPSGERICCLFPKTATNFLQYTHNKHGTKHASRSYGTGPPDVV